MAGPVVIIFTLFALVVSILFFFPSLCTDRLNLRMHKEDISSPLALVLDSTFPIIMHWREVLNSISDQGIPYILHPTQLIN